MKNKSHHNTTNEVSEQLSLFEARATKQESIVLALYVRHSALTASECFKLYPDRTVPITSIRRAITNLTKYSKIEKTNKKKTGIYGRPEFVYELNPLM